MFNTNAVLYLSYLKVIPIDIYPKIFSAEFDAVYFLKLISIFQGLAQADSVLTIEGLKFLIEFLRGKLVLLLLGLRFNVHLFPLQSSH